MIGVCPMAWDLGVWEPGVEVAALTHWGTLSLLPTPLFWRSEAHSLMVGGHSAAVPGMGSWHKHEALWVRGDSGHHLSKKNHQTKNAWHSTLQPLPPTANATRAGLGKRFCIARAQVLGAKEYAQASPSPPWETWDPASGAGALSCLRKASWVLSRASVPQ